ALDIAVVNVAVALCVGETGSGGARVIRRARIALGAVAPTPVLAPKAGEALKGLDLSGAYPEEIDRRIKDAARLAADASRPITDIRASGEYRRHLVKVLAERALRSALESITYPEEG
ncbi:MAG: hypothetical protein HYY09_08575, partial [Firmicutes bacterium]|nr:hypothetical protein [Bacillota bacterium]